MYYLTQYTSAIKFTKLATYTKPTQKKLSGHGQIQAKMSVYH